MIVEWFRIFYGRYRNVARDYRADFLGLQGRRLGYVFCRKMFDVNLGVTLHGRDEFCWFWCQILWCNRFDSLLDAGPVILILPLFFVRLTLHHSIRFGFSALRYFFLKVWLSKILELLELWLYFLRRRTISSKNFSKLYKTVLSDV